MNHAETRKSQTAHKKALCEADRSFGARFRDDGSLLRQSQRDPANLHSQPEGFLDRGFLVSDQSAETFNALGSDLVEEIVRNFGWACVRVRGTSMTPAVQPGDLLTIQHIRFRDVSIGQIVLYARDARLVTHRVVEKSDGPQGPRLITCGDRVSQNDYPVSPEELLGCVKFIDRCGKRFQPADHLGAQGRLLCRLLRASDRATSIYLRLTDLWRTLAGEGAW